MGLTTDDRPELPSGRRLALMAMLYAAVAVAATFPAITTVATELPGHPSDPVVHLWTMRWHRQCLLEGRLPFHAPGLQHPVGAVVGYLPPLQYQTALFIGLSAIIPNDVLCFNLIWFSGLILTGLGTFVLAWYVLREAWGAAMAGLLGMLAGPITYFASAEIEQITLGWFPLFLVGWLRFVDRPSRGRLGVAVGTYLLLAMSAPYYGVFGVFPATLYVCWAAWSRRGSGWWRFLVDRLGWFAGFVGLAFPALMVLFSSQIWAMVHGFPMDRTSAEFAVYKASPWGYLVPVSPKFLATWLQGPASSLLRGAAYFPAYLGVVTLGLLGYAAAARIRFARASFWWLALLTLFVLSLGPSITVAGTEITLPSYWLREYAKILKPVRVPARFAYFAAILVALIGAAGFGHLLARIPGTAGRRVVGTALMGLAFLDLAHIPFSTAPLPPPPAAYGFVRAKDPDAVVFDAPHLNTGWRLPALCTYWQSVHGLKTSAGYTADMNPVHENLVSHGSPFHAFRLSDPSYCEGEEPIHFDPIGLAGAQRFEDVAWLSLEAFGFDYLILHHRPGDYPDLPVRFDRIAARLAPAKVFEDEEAALFEVDRMPTPARPTLICAEGWRGYVPSRMGLGRLVDRVSHLALYVPDPDEPVVLALRGASRRPSRAVELRDGDEVLARWELRGGEEATLISPPIRLPEGLHRLTLWCDGWEPDASDVPHFAKERKPYGLWVSGLGFGPTAEVAVTWEASRVIASERPAGRVLR